MTAAPRAPGRGLPVYQPATVVLDGTCSVPSAASPSFIMLVCTPMAGIVRLTGSATGAGVGAGSCARYPWGTVTWCTFPAVAAGRPVWLAQPSPAPATHSRNSPAVSAAAAHGRRADRARSRGWPCLLPRMALLPAREHGPCDNEREPCQPDDD